MNPSYDFPCKSSRHFLLLRNRFLRLRQKFVTERRVGREIDFVGEAANLQLDPDFNAWQEILAYASGVFASEAVARTWSIQFPWLDRPNFYRSGLPTRTLVAHFAGTIQNLCKCTRPVGVFRKSVRPSVHKLRNHPERQGGVCNENKRNYNHTKRKCD